MRHAVAGSKLGRNTPHRRATFRNLAAALFQHGQITTTIRKAKAVQPFVERLITLARRGDLHARRRATSLLGGDRDLIRVVKGGAADEEIEDNTLVQKLFEEIGPRFKDRPGGYTRVIKLAKYRIGDGTDLVVLQLVGDDEKHNHTSKSSRRAAADRRTAFAAKLRKGAKSEAKAQAPAETEAAPEAEQASAEQAESAPAEEKPAEPEASAETTEESAEQENKSE